jgi:hypothetical protein
MPKIKNYKLVEDLPYQKIYVHRHKGIKIRLDKLFSPTSGRSAWSVTILRYIPADLDGILPSRLRVGWNVDVFKYFDSYKEASKFAISWMRQHLNG